ncbi:MAG: Asp23/Gls24 family envelope stress response protein [Oscillospiraceae bacterium]|jgi:uncharacterized alkaline shock family protein YloU|nr:Asp23/Gls24 family envelope stress response protein [Oscillospiraceae bacterium]
MGTNSAEQHVLGNLKLSDHVVETIVKTATNEIKNVMYDAGSGFGLRNMLDDLLPRSQKITVNEGAISVNLRVKVLAATNLNDSAKKVQENVKNAIQNITGFFVSKVNVTISGTYNSNATETKEDDTKNTLQNE